MEQQLFERGEASENTTQSSSTSFKLYYITISTSEIVTVSALSAGAAGVSSTARGPRSLSRAHRELQGQNQGPARQLRQDLVDRKRTKGEVAAHTTLGRGHDLHPDQLSGLSTRC